MYILGISCFYHDAAAALLKDGKIVAAAEEERFTRIKHDTSFPINAIRYCLDSQSIGINDLEYIGFYEKPLLKFERVLFQHIDRFPFSVKTFVNSMPSWINEKLRIPEIIRKRLGYNKGVLFINHHMAHASSAYLMGPFEKAAIVTVDGVGEWATTTIGLGDSNKIALREELRFPHSLGLLYSTITAYLGFSVNNSEYKVMGLASFGNNDRRTNQFYKKLKSVIDLREDGSFRLDMSYFRYNYSDRMPSRKLCGLLGGIEKKKETALTKRHKDIAAALQMLTEDVLIKILEHANRITGCDNLVMAGGVALNSVFNGKILKKTKFKKVWVQPASGDSGASMGVAAYIYHAILNNTRKCVLDDVFLGPQFDEEDIKEFLETNGIKFTVFNNERKLLKETARLINQGYIIGWFQGRMEFGPRSLGSRSILANACNSGMKDRLNSKVKHRENFRPFAPAMCFDDAQKYFEIDDPIPGPAEFMLMVYPVKKEHRTLLGSVTNVDGTGRIQTVKLENNRLFYGLIKEFGKLSGMPILINTSFNVRGEPIVCTPYDAYKCMMGTGIDYLVIGNFLVSRNDNLKDAWDSSCDQSLQRKD